VDSRRARLRAHRRALYETGEVPDASGTPVPLHPDGLIEADSDAICVLAEHEGVRRTLEIGAGVGMGTLALCEALLGVGADDARNTLVDPFEFRGDVGARTVSDAGADDLVERIRERSQLALPRLVAEGREYDLALVDGGHRFEEVFLDLIYSGMLVRPRGLIVVDDLWLPGIRLAVSYLESNLGYELEPDLHPGGFRWRRSLPFRGRRWSGRVAVLRTPAEGPAPAWDAFLPFSA
jgi:predicted O-methyltransferase YrrM